MPISTAAVTVMRGAVLPDQPHQGAVDVAIAAGRIVEVAPAGSLDAPDVTTLDGAWLLPGFVDAHVHPIHAETLASVGDAAPERGITTVLDHFYPERGRSLLDEAARADREAGAGAADYGFHVRVTPDRLGTDPLGGSDQSLTEDLRRLSRAAGVVSVKSFLSHSDPSVMVTPAQLTRVLHAAGPSGLPVIVHAEPGEVIAVLDGIGGAPASLEQHDRRRAPDLEAAAVALAAATARAVGTRLYVAHLSSELAVGAVHRAAALGTRIRGESCAHYMTLDSSADVGSLGRVTPPLRSARSVLEMRRLAAQSGSGIDVLASDHCGYVAEEKPLDDFASAGNGLPGLDSLVPLLLDAVIDGGWLTAADVVRLASRGPAETFGLTGKGRISAGADADLVIVDPAGVTTLHADPPGPATAHSPYAQRRTRGAVTHVLRRGVPLVWESEATEAASRGGGRAVERTEPTW